RRPCHTGPGATAPPVWACTPTTWSGTPQSPAVRRHATRCTTTDTRPALARRRASSHVSMLFNRQQEGNMGSLSDKDLALIDAYWRAANYLSIGQIYLYDNPLLKKPLTREHVKPRLLGHWGTTPGLNFIYVHLNRVIKKHDLNMLYIAGPGHG